MNELRKMWSEIWGDQFPGWAWIYLFAAAMGTGVIQSGRAFSGGLASLMLLLSVTAFVAAYALFKRRRWGGLYGGLYLAVVEFESIRWLFVLERKWSTYLGPIVVAYAIWAVIRDMRKWSIQEQEAGDSNDQSSPMISLVLLLKEPQQLDATILAKVASKAWDAEVKTIDESGDDDSNHSFVGGDSPHFICSHGGGFFAIHNLDQPYFEDVEHIANAVPELRRQKAIREHTAWVSCDLIRWLEPGDGLSQAYRLIARLLCELLDDNCLAIIDPEAQQVFLNDPETESKLRSDDPRAALQESYYVPVIAVAPDDPRMLAAVAEARSRFEEFVTAFEQREESGNELFLKAPFSENDVTEFMWLKVEAIENGVVFGTLGNDPNDIPSLCEGSRVTTKASELNDWIIQPPSGDFIGGFTIHVLSGQAEEQNDESGPSK